MTSEEEKRTVKHSFIELMHEQASHSGEGAEYDTIILPYIAPQTPKLFFAKSPPHNIHAQRYSSTRRRIRINKGRQNEEEGVIADTPPYHSML